VLKRFSVIPLLDHSITLNEDWSEKSFDGLLFAVVRDFRVQGEAEPRAIIHLDMDCFYAAIEVRDRPSLRGKPVGVGGARDRRGVLTTCNYECQPLWLCSVARI